MQRRGAAAVLAMIFLVIFGALSCAFFAVISTSMAVAKNDRDAQHARAAAESGMEYVKHAISWEKISSTVPEDLHIDEVQQTLEAISNNWSTKYSGRVITIPASGDLSLQTGQHSFHAEISEVTSVTPRELFVSVTGKDGHSDLTRSVSALFKPRNLGEGVFEFSMPSAGGIYIDNATVDASRGIMSATSYDDAIYIDNARLTAGTALAVTINDDPEDGQVEQYPKGSYDVTVISPPTFPGFNTDIYRPFAINSYSAVSSQQIWTNVRVTRADVPGGTLRINGNNEIRGLLYIEPGIDIVVNGNPVLRGLVVCAQDPNNPTAINMSGDFTVSKSTIGMDPALVAIAEGLTILAPTATISTTGSSRMQMEGSIVCSRFVASSNGGDITITNGALMTLYDGPMSTSDPEDTAALYLSNRTITFNITDPNFKLPTAALLYKKQYVMATETYLEQ